MFGVTILSALQLKFGYCTKNTFIFWSSYFNTANTLWCFFDWCTLQSIIQHCPEPWDITDAHLSLHYITLSHWLRFSNQKSASYNVCLDAICTRNRLELSTDGQSLLLTPFHYQVCQMAASVFQRVAAHRHKNSSVPPLLVMHAERILCQPPHGVRELECCLFIAAHLLPPTPSLPHWTGPAQQIEKSYMAIRILLSPSV